MKVVPFLLHKVWKGAGRTESPLMSIRDCSLKPEAQQFFTCLYHINYETARVNFVNYTTSTAIFNLFQAKTSLVATIGAN